MPKARTRVQRGEQMKRWLNVRFPTRYPVSVYWRTEIVDIDGEELDGYCRRGDDGKSYNVYLSFNEIRRVAEVSDAMMHEWAHLLRGLQNEEDDPTYWGEYYGPLYWAFHYEGGSDEVDQY